MLLALRVRDFRLLWGARLVSSLGSWLLVIAVPAHVLLLTGSVRATGLTLAAEYLPAVVGGPLAGVVADRWDRRRLMVATDLFRAVAVALMLVASSTVWVVYVALVAESAGTVLFNPAAQAHTPVVVGTGSLLSSANALNAVTDGTVRLLGGPVGGLLLAVVGFDLLVWVDVLSYVVSGVAIGLTEVRPSRSVARSSLIAGFRALRGSPLVSALLPITAVYLLANACLSAVLIPFGVLELGGAGSLGFLLSGLGVGFLLGAPLARLLVDRVPVRYVLSAGLVGVACAY